MRELKVVPPPLAVCLSATQNHTRRYRVCVQSVNRIYERISVSFNVNVISQYALATVPATAVPGANTFSAPDTTAANMTGSTALGKVVEAMTPRTAQRQCHVRL